MNQQNELAVFDGMRADMALLVSPMKDLVVTNPTERDAAIEAGKRVKSLLKAIEDKRKELTTPLRDRVNAFNDRAKQITEPLLAAEIRVKDTVRDFELKAIKEREAETERLRKEAVEREAKIEADRSAAEIAAEKERKAEERRIAAELKAKRDAEEKERIEAEELFGASSKAEKAAAAAEQQRIIDAEKEARRLRDEAAVRDREVSRAAAERESEERRKADEAREKTLAAERTKNMRTIPEWSCVDELLVPRQYLMIDEKAVNQAVKRDGVRSIPGIEITMVTSLALGTR